MIGPVLLPLFLLPAAQDAEAFEPPSIARFPDWDERDAEGRWALFAKDLALDDDVAKAWQPFLAENRDFTLLEWIVTTQPKAWSGARSALVHADAPQWIRATVSRLSSTDSHAAQNARADLMKHAGAFLGWLELYPEARRGAAATLAGQLDAVANRAAAAPYLPPLSDADLYGALSAEDPAEFGDAKTAAPGVVYVQTVERAISAVAATTERTPEVLDRLRALALGPNERLARAACVAFTSLAPQEIPDVELANLAGDADAPAAVRELAFLAASYGPNPRALVRLHVHALDPTDPHWRAAVSRLGEVGDGYTAHLLASLEPGPVAPEDVALLDVAREQIEARVAADTSPVATHVQELLERAAWADLTCAKVETTLVSWTLDHIRAAQPDPELRRVLAELAATYVPDESVRTSIELGGAVFGDMQTRVRQYASELLAE